MIIKTITCHDCYNLGASLQAFALQKYMQGEGHDVEIIHYKPDYLSGHFRLWVVSNPLYNKIVIKQLYLLAKLPKRLIELRRKKAFDEFTTKYLCLTRKYNSYEELKLNAPEADIYIAGSDQIWNTTFKNGTDPAFYLDFGLPHTIRLSYAASFATDKLIYGTENFVKTKLANFDCISVRERSALKLLSGIGHKGFHVVDPVFLLPVVEWNKLSNNVGEGDDYVLVYDFMNDPNIRYVVKYLANEYSCKIYSIGPYKMNYADKNYWKDGPRTFLSLVKNAKCVVSNSLHATAFSIIFERDFFVVNRKDGLNIRMRDILLQYNLSIRLISSDVSKSVLLSHIDYAEIREKVNHDVEDSKKWLLNNLRIQK